MYIQLIRNKPQGNAITGRLVIDSRWFCYTLERVGYQIPALCYHVAVTMSPKFKRLLPLVTGVPRTPQSGYGTATPIGRANGAMGYRQGIRIHRGTKPEHSTGCILVVGDNNNNNSNNINQQLLRSQQHSERSGEGNSVPLGCVVPQRNVVEDKVVDVVDNKTPVGCRSAADIESQLTQLLFQAQNAHEEIILEVIDFTPGTEYGYNHSCPSSECACEKEIRSAHFARRHSSSILVPTRHSDDF